MKTDMNGRRHRGLRAKKRKRIIGITAIVTVLCAIAVLLSFTNRSTGVGRTDTYESGSASLVYSDPERIPDYSGQDYVILNDGKPCFGEWDLENISGEHYSDLDDLGRCGAAIAMLDRTMRPEGERGEIGHIKPSGWNQEKYEGIVASKPPYLYNRCHLIAFALTGQNANERNLITGTRCMNVTTMLPWEEKVMRYLDDSDDHVLYRVTPYFRGSELLARGDEMEAYSVEDKGESLCFHVFIYNVQPGIELDYATGESWPDK